MSGASQPLAPQLENSMNGGGQDVPDRVRRGESVPYADAAAYSSSVGYRAGDYTGCKVAKCAGVPVGLTANCVCNDCFCFVPLALFVLPFPFCCSCEREGNEWVTRGKMQVKSGVVTVVDQEKGTLVWYGQTPCDQEPTQTCCYCYSLC